MTFSSDTKFSVKQGQIICLEHDNNRLYACIIQYIESQQTYWIRPLCLLNTQETKSQIISLHGTSDVILPKNSFRLVWDTEILEFWTELDNNSGIYEDNPIGRAELHGFLKKFPWLNRQPLN